MNYENVTEADAKEAGIKFELLKEWFKVNGQICTWLKDHGMKAKNDNGIWKYKEYRFQANFINNDYLEFRVHMKDTELLILRHYGNVKTFLHCFVAVIVEQGAKN